MPTYRARLTVITPVHIGSGEELHRDFDYVADRQRTWRLNVDRILEERFQQWQRMAQGGDYPPPARLLAPEDFRRRDFFRYVLPGVPQSTRVYAALRAFIKDPWDRPYIPGSSIKGAIRTALAWAGWREAGARVDRVTVRQWEQQKRQRRLSPRWVGRTLERNIFGPDPNHDLLRALQVSDFFGPREPGQGLMVVNARVVTRRGFQAPIPVEALRGDVTFEGTLKIDDYLLQGLAAQKLGFHHRSHWLTAEFIPRLQQYARARLETLAREMEERFGTLPGASRLAAFFRELRSLPLSSTQTLLALGWGTGWDGKTFWTHLTENAAVFEGLVRVFNLQRRPRGAPPRQPGTPFPASRRMVVRNGSLAAPFGWVLLEIQPV